MGTPSLYLDWPSARRGEPSSLSSDWQSGKKGESSLPLLGLTEGEGNSPLLGLNQWKERGNPLPLLGFAWMNGRYWLAVSGKTKMRLWARAGRRNSPPKVLKKGKKKKEVYISAYTKAKQNREARSTRIDNSLIWKSELHKRRWWHDNRINKGLGSPKQRSSLHRNFKYMVTDVTLRLKAYASWR